jgi:uncharacterized protein YjbI with pentapeptide repeats
MVRAIEGKIRSWILSMGQTNPSGNSSIDVVSVATEKRGIPLLRNAFVLLIVGGVIGFSFFQQDQNLRELSSKISKLESQAPINMDEKQRRDFEKDILSFQRDYTNARNSFYGSMIQIVSSGLLLLTAYIGWRNLGIAYNTLHVTQDRFNLDRSKIELENFYKILEDVEDSSRMIKQSAALYKLNKIAKEADQDRQEYIARFLLAYLKFNTQYFSSDSLASEVISSNDSSDPKVINSKQSDIVRDILNILFSIKEKLTGISIDLSYLNLAGIMLENISLEGINLEKIVLKNCQLNKLVFSEANLKSATFEKATINSCQFKGAELNSASFKGAQFRGKSLFEKAKMRDVDMRDVSLCDGDFTDSILHSANFDASMLSRCKFNNANLNQASFKKAHLRYADFTNATLNGSSWEGADILSVNFEGAKINNYEELKKAKNWETAKYSDLARTKLNL